MPSSRTKEVCHLSCSTFPLGSPHKNSVWFPSSWSSRSSLKSSFPSQVLEYGDRWASLRCILWSVCIQKCTFFLMIAFVFNSVHFPELFWCWMALLNKQTKQNSTDVFILLQQFIIKPPRGKRKTKPASFLPQLSKEAWWQVLSSMNWNVVL